MNRSSRLIRPWGTWGIALALLACVALQPVLAADDAEGQEPAEAKLTVQVVRLRGAYADHPTPGGLDPMALLTGGPQKQRSFPKLCEAIDAIAADDAVDVVFFDLSEGFGLNLAQMAEFLRHVEALTDAKKTFAWLENAGTSQLLVASAADTVLMADFGVLDMPSLAMSSMHFKDLMDLAGVRASIARVGDFKGAVEPFMNSEMSRHLHDHYLRMLTSMNDFVVDRVGSGRKLAAEHVRAAQGRRMFTAKAAREANLVDALAPYGGAREMVECLLDAKGNVTWREKRKQKRQPPNFFEMMTRLMGAGVVDKKITEPTIAVLHLDGQIVDGKKAQPGTMVAGPAVEDIEKLIGDEQIKGVVVRINSPGGSATASEAIRRALQELADSKPVVISMGSVAASGGYWITCLGRPIYAEPGTITGSIGVFAMKIHAGPLLNRLGIHIENITLDDSASAMSLDRGWSEQELAGIQEMIDEVYDRFLHNVSVSRGMSKKDVDAVGGGRVWSGTQAKTLGLIDHIGGTDAAVAAVALEAGLAPDAPVIHRPRPKQLFELLDLFGGGDDDLTDVIDGARLALLERAGFDVRGPLRLLGEALDDGTGPRIWALSPVQLQVR